MLIEALTIAVVAVFAILTGVLSALLERSSPIRLRHWAEEAGDPLLSVCQHRSHFEILRFLLSSLSRLGLLGVFAAGVAISGRIWIAVVVSVVILMASEVLSRILVARNPETALRRLTGTYRVTLSLLTPAILALRPLLPTHAMERQAEIGELETSEGEIDAFISVGQREGILEPGEEELVKGVVEFGDTLVKSVMIPRIDMVAASVDSTLDDLVTLFIESGHSRIPLYRESMDEVEGILHLRDLLEALRAAVPRDAASMLMEPFIVPETKRISVLLREFQTRRQQLAVVVDEFGGVAGVVTVEDLLEEIVGEIADEHEDYDLERVPLGNGVWQLDGACQVEALQELFDVELGITPYETLGGLVFTELGHLPAPGERLSLHGLDFKVMDVSHRRIRTVCVERSTDAT